MKKNISRRVIINIFLQPLLIFWSALQLFPLFWLIYSSFKTSDEIQRNIFSLPKKIAFTNYISAWTDPFVTVRYYLQNSIIVTTMSILLLILVSSLAGYALAKFNILNKKYFLLILIIIIGVPIHSYLIPLYFFIADIGLLNNYLGLILPYIGFFAPFSTIMFYTYFKKFPNELIEAARIDGCREVWIFFNIVAPISVGVVASVLIVSFISIWNEFLFGLVVMKNNINKTLPVGVAGFTGGNFPDDLGRLYAALVISILPIILFYFIFQRKIIKGMQQGAIKG